jgi:hypothetical protein
MVGMQQTLLISVACRLPLWQNAPQLGGVMARQLILAAGRRIVDLQTTLQMLAFTLSLIMV